MKRRQRDPEAVTVPAHLADPAVEGFVEPTEVSSISEAQELAADRHSDAWSAWCATLPVATVGVPVVWDRTNLGTAQIDDVVEVTGPLLEGLSAAQARWILLGEPLAFQDREAFRRAMNRGAT